MAYRWTDNELDNSLYEALVYSENPSEKEIRELVAKGANVNAVDSNGDSLLMNGKTTMLTNQLGYIKAKEFKDFSWRANFEPNPSYLTAWPDYNKVAHDVLSRQRDLTLEEMRAQVKRVKENAIQSTKERIKMKPETTFEPLAKLQAKLHAEIVNVPLSVVHLKNDPVRCGTWYEIPQNNEHELTLSLNRPYYFEQDKQHGIGMVVIHLGYQILGHDETMLLRHEDSGEGAYFNIELGVSKKLSEQGYDSVIFYEKDDNAIQLREVFIFDGEQSKSNNKKGKN